MKKTYTISEISKLYNIGVDSIRYYEEIGLIKPKRGNNNYRYYDGDDIYKLNIIRELLDLGFSTQEIQHYFAERNINSTYALLKREKERIDKQINKLRSLKDNVDIRLKDIKQIRNIKFETVSEKKFEKRKYSILNVGYTEDNAMNILIQKLSQFDGDDFYIIGNNRIGTVVEAETYFKEKKVNYSGVFMFSKHGKEILQEGKYLSILYKGDYKKTEMCIDKIIEYAQNHNLKLASNFFEIIWVDIHSTDYMEEYVTEVQVLVEDEKNF